MLRYRRIDSRGDRDVLLNLHCQINYASDTPFARRMPYREYRRIWMNSRQPEQFLAELNASMEDEGTMAEILENEKGEIVGYLWVVLKQMEGYDAKMALIMDMAVTPEFRGRGIGRKMLEHIEEVAKMRGANFLRSEIGVENVASKRLHEGFGFKAYRIMYEKHLTEDYGKQQVDVSSSHSSHF